MKLNYGIMVYVKKKTINFGSRLRHVNSESQKHIKEYEFIGPEIDELNYVLNDTIKCCKKKYFHSLEMRCVDDIKFINMEINEEVISTCYYWVHEIQINSVD